MKKTISERLTLILKEFNMSRAELASKMNYHNSVVNNVVNMRNLPSFDFLYRLKQYDNRIDMNWLIHGDGEMFINENRGSQDEVNIWKELAESLKRENELLREKIEQQSKSNDFNSKSKNS